MDPREHAQADVIRAAAEFRTRHGRRWRGSSYQPQPLDLAQAMKIARLHRLVPRETLVRAGGKPRKVMP